MKFTIRYICLVLIIFTIQLSFYSCKEKEKNICPPFDWIPPSPFDNPICHPSGKIIGYNHTPIKEIQYSYGYDCPNQASYVYDNTQSGFWLMDSDGQNQRRVLPFYLNTPSWSPDGKWIIFSNGNIFKMAFDGNNFDTTSIIQMTSSGHNFYPQFSPNGNFIAYDNTECGSAVDPPPPNSCGILIMDTVGNNKSFITSGRFPYWGRTEDTIYFILYYYDLITHQEQMILDNVKMGFTLEGCASFNSQKNRIYFLGRFFNESNPIRLYSVDLLGKDFRLVSSDPIMSFSFLNDGRIVYLYFDNRRIDKEKGTIWIMNQDGSNKKQLTSNDFNISY